MVALRRSEIQLFHNIARTVGQVCHVRQRIKLVSHRLECAKGWKRTSAIGYAGCCQMIVACGIGGGCDGGVMVVVAQQLVVMMMMMLEVMMVVLVLLWIMLAVMVMVLVVLEKGILIVV